MIYKASYSLIKPKNTKNLNNIVFNESLRPVLHGNKFSPEEQNRRDNIAFTLDRQYHCLRKNVPYDSKESFGDDVTKRMTTMKNNEKLFQTTSKS